MANGLPWFPFYPADFMVATMGWENEHIGMYMKLLMLQWDRDGLPNDPDRLRRMVGCSEDAWSNAWAFLSIKFEDCSDGKLRNKRLAEIQQEQLKKREQNVARARRASKLRWQKEKKSGDARSNAPRMQNQSQIKKGSPPPTPPLPAELNQAAWEDWLAYRKEARFKKYAQVTVTKQVKWLARFSEAVQRQIIDHSIRMGYQGLFDPKDRKGGYEIVSAVQRGQRATGAE